MGKSGSRFAFPSGDAEAREQKKNSKKIEQTLARDGATEQRVIKLLLLGTGDSGKSTIMKQVHTESCATDY